jgi:hypothetical protein
MPATLRYPLRVLGQRPASSVRCDQVVSTPASPATGVQCPARAFERPCVRVQASGVRAFPRPLCPAQRGRGARRWGRPPHGWHGRGRRGRPLRRRPARGLPESERGARSSAQAVLRPAEVSVCTWPSSWAVVGQWPDRPRGRLGEAGCADDRSSVGSRGAQRGSPPGEGCAVRHTSTMAAESRRGPCTYPRRRTGHRIHHNGPEGANDVLR